MWILDLVCTVSKYLAKSVVLKVYVHKNKAKHIFKAIKLLFQNKLLVKTIQDKMHVFFQMLLYISTAHANILFYLLFSMKNNL